MTFAELINHALQTCETQPVFDDINQTEQEQRQAKIDEFLVKIVEQLAQDKDASLKGNALFLRAVLFLKEGFVESAEAEKQMEKFEALAQDPHAPIDDKADEEDGAEADDEESIKKEEDEPAEVMLKVCACLDEAASLGNYHAQLLFADLLKQGHAIEFLKDTSEEKAFVSQYLPKDEPIQNDTHIRIAIELYKKISEHRDAPGQVKEDASFQKNRLELALQEKVVTAVNDALLGKTGALAQLQRNKTVALSNIGNLDLNLEAAHITTLSLDKQPRAYFLRATALESQPQFESSLSFDERNDEIVRCYCEAIKLGHVEASFVLANSYNAGIYNPTEDNHAAHIAMITHIGEKSTNAGEAIERLNMLLASDPYEALSAQCTSKIQEISTKQEEAQKLVQQAEQAERERVEAEQKEQRRLEAEQVKREQIEAERKAAEQKQAENKATIATVRTLNKKTDHLFEQINKLRDYGKKLGTEANGTVAIELADAIETKVCDFIIKVNAKDTPANEKDKAAFQAFKDSITKEISDKQKDLQTHRAQWKPLIANILLAFTGIGLAALLVKAIVVKIKGNKENAAPFNRFAFWGTTHRQDLANSIAKSVDSTKEINPFVDTTNFIK